MTRDEVMALEAGPETNALVAQEIFGQAQWCPDDPDDPLCRCSLGKPHTIHFRVSLPDFSDDITAAWEVETRMRFCLIPRIDGGWNAMPWEDVSATGALPASAGSALTASLAICRAALLAVMEVDDD